MTTPTPTSTPSAPSVPHYPEQVTGMFILAKALKNIGIDTMYGLVGIPVTDFSYLCQEQGIRFVGFRHEQQAGMAAATHGYLTGKPGVLLTVSSLGFLNGLTATINATVNCYPMIQISGSSQREPIDLDQGTYEGLDQLNVAKGLVKAAYRVNRPQDIPTAVARAYRAAVSGRPGGVYLDITTPCLGEVVNADEAEKWFFTPVDPVAKTYANSESIDRAVELLKNAKRPAIVLGKGAAFIRADETVKQFVEQTGMPFFPMSMAKGLLPDTHPQSALACRSTIMGQADIVVLIGARLNWLLSRGRGKWNPEGQFIQFDVAATEMDCNRPIAAPVVGDIETSLKAVLAKLQGSKLNMDPTWMSSLAAETKTKNATFAERLAAAATVQPMTHWTALNTLKPLIEANPDLILINEGANTLDDTRDTINLSLPRHRVDCATWAIMGMGIGSTIGAAIATGKSVIAIEGDSAFGFSGMDVATICRFKLPCTIVVFNNGGIYNGIGVNMSKDGDPAPTTLDIDARYEKIGEAFGAAAYYVTTPDELKAAFTEAVASKKPAIINVQLGADSGKESGHIGYLNPEAIQHVIV